MVSVYIEKKIIVLFSEVAGLTIFCFTSSLLSGRWSLLPRVSPLLSCQVHSQPGRDSSINSCSVHHWKVSAQLSLPQGHGERQDLIVAVDSAWESTWQAAQHFRDAWQVISEKRKHWTVCYTEAELNKTTTRPEKSRLKKTVWQNYIRTCWRQG